MSVGNLVIPDLHERLVRCFSTVFPQLTESEIPRANQSSVANWDSLATVTLISVIEEEFDLVVAPEDIENIISFDLSLDCVKRRVGNGS
jgi:acyl carrier protein